MAVRPFLFGNFIIRIGDSLAIIVVKDFEGLVAEVSGNIMGEKQPAADDGKNKHAAIEQQVGKVRLERTGSASGFGQILDRVAVCVDVLVLHKLFVLAVHGDAENASQRDKRCVRANSNPEFHHSQ
jgi:hypothetical protein